MYLCMHLFAWISIKLHVEALTMQVFKQDVIFSSQKLLAPFIAGREDALCEFLQPANINIKCTTCGRPLPGLR